MNLYKETILYPLIVIFMAVLPNVGSAETERRELSVETSFKTIVIDPGFGGNDLGPSGYIEGVHAKDVNLQIARKLAKRIREGLRLKVILTRSSDQFVALEKRTALANISRGDLFISIHCNAHPDQEVYGIETYFLNMDADESSVAVEAEKNADSEKHAKDLEKVLNDLIINSNVKQSRVLATLVQESLCRHMKDRYNSIKNRGVKHAPFSVLMGAAMPAVLVEVSYISNPRECKRLMSEDYQDDLCEGIFNGIEQYIKSIENRS